MDLNNIRGKKVLIVGLGLQGGGLGVVRSMCAYGAVVTVTDLKTEEALKTSLDMIEAENLELKLKLGGHELADFLNTDYIIKGPSVNPNNEFIASAEARGIPVLMETAIFMQNVKCKTIGVTGTRGKSTVTDLIYTVLKQKYKKGNVFLAGNIPNRCALELLPTIKPDDICVLELSSWQLWGIGRAKISPDIAVFTNFYEDHLNYYTTMQSYFDDKSQIYAYQPPGHKLYVSGNFDPRYLDQIKASKPDVVICEPYDHSRSGIPGLHNRYNISIARAVCAEVLGDAALPTIDDTLLAYGGLNYRLQSLGKVQNLEFVNDSTSTTPTSGAIAIQAYPSSKLVLILGGNTKNLSPEILSKAISARRDDILDIYFLPGTFTDLFVQILDAMHIRHSGVHLTINQILEKIYSKYCVVPHDIKVVFTPSATSFATFKNEFDRANQFDQEVATFKSIHNFQKLD